MFSCCFTPILFSLNVKSTSEKVLGQLNRHPTLVSSPAPSSALSGLHDTALHVASEQTRPEAIQQIFHFLAISDLATVHEALQPYCRRAKLPLPDNTTEALRVAANMANSKGQTPLMYASYADCPAIVIELLRHGADPWAADRCGCRNALHYAAMAGSASCVEALVRNTPPNLLMRQGVRYIDSRSLSGLTSLHYAAFYERQAAVRELLRYEPNINAASTGESFDVWITYDTYCTPLHFAAYKDCTAVARMLLFHYAIRRRTGTMLDPRLRYNSANKLPWQVAQSRALATMLHPAMQLRDVLGPELDAALAVAQQVGPPPLAALAAAALRQKLLHAVEVIERECAEGDELERAQSVRRKTMLLCGTPRCSSALASRPSVSRRLASFRLAHGATGSNLPSDSHRAPTLDRLDGPRLHAPDVTEPPAARPASGDGTGTGLGVGREGPQSARTRPPSPSGRTTRTAVARPRSDRVPVVKSRGRGLGAVGAEASGCVIGREGQRGLGSATAVHSTAAMTGGAFGGGGGLGSPVTTGAGNAGAQAGRPAGGGGGGGGGVAVDICDAMAAEEIPDSGSQLLGDSPAASVLMRQARELQCQGFLGLGPGAGATPRAGSPPPCGGSSPSGPSTTLSPAPSLMTPAGFAAAIAQHQQQQAPVYAGTAPGNTILSPAASLLSGSIVFGVEGDGDGGATADGDGGGRSTGVVLGEVRVRGCEDDEDDDDDETCKVCFVRQEIVAPATCRHGLCSICAGELCRAVVSKPLLCPFCRRPVKDFVRVVPKAPARG